MKQEFALTTKGLIAQLQAVAVRPTAQRIAILKYVLSEGNHPSAEEVKNWVDDHFPKISMATVYNTLRTLVDAGIIREFKLPHTSKVVYDNNVTRHHHFLDENTGQLFDVTPDMIELKPRLKREYDITEVHVLMRGRKRLGSHG